MSFLHLRGLHERLNIFQKVLTANAVLLITGVLAGTSLALRTLTAHQPLFSTFFAFTLAGVAASLLLNFFLLRLAFQPLFRLKTVMERIHAGNYEARAPEIHEDPDVRKLGETLNLMLDRLAQYRKESSSRILHALEDDRRRIAAELHDETSQSLTFMLIQLDLLREQAKTGSRDELTAAIDRISQLTGNALDNVRRLTLELRPSVLDDLGLVPALRWFIREKIEPLDVRVELSVGGFETRLSDVMETTLFRICQEALANVLKHAQATYISVDLRESGDTIHLCITDNGRGFSEKEVAGRDSSNRGLGLISMRERTVLCGGNFEVHSQPGKGTRIIVNLPKEVSVQDESRHPYLPG